MTKATLGRLGLSLFIIVGFAGCRPEPPAPPPPKTEKPAPVVGQDVTFTITENGKKSWILHAEQATYSPDQRVAHLTTVKGRAFRADGQPLAEFVAPTGVYDQVSKAITLRDGVTAKSTASKPVILTAPVLTWATQSPMATATGGVTVQNPGFGKSTADRCQFSLDFSRIALEGNATTTATQ